MTTFPKKSIKNPPFSGECVTLNPEICIPNHSSGKRMFPPVTEHICTTCEAVCDEDQLYCTQCGSVLLHALQHNSNAFNEITQRLGAPEGKEVALEWGTAYFHPNARLVLQFMETNEELPIRVGFAPLIIGRRSGNSVPHVDLLPFGGSTKGVSRQHVRIERDGDSLLVTDIGSHNGTFLNQERLVVNRPYLLRNRAALQLGYLLIRVQFK